MTATAGSEQATTGSEGPASAVLDQTTGTIWHSKWSGDARENLWIDIALGESKTVTGLRMLPRSGGGNGTITPTASRSVMITARLIRKLPRVHGTAVTVGRWQSSMPSRLPMYASMR